MKNIIIICAVLLLSSCAKQSVEPKKLTPEEINRQYKINYGTAVFWMKSSTNLGLINVTIDGLTFQTSMYYSSAPACGSDRSATFSLSEGMHNYTAKDYKDTRKWSGTVTVSEGQCTTVQIQ